MAADRVARRPGVVRRAPDPAGLVLGVLFAMLAMTPSLLPRTWLFQGIVSGISAAIGYAVGVTAAWGLRHWGPGRRLGAVVAARTPERVRRAVVPGLCVLAVPALLVTLAVAARWQRELSASMGATPTTASGWLRAAPVLVVLAVVLVLLARVVRALARVVARVLRRRLRLPRVVAAAVAAVLVGLGVLVVVNDVLLARALSAADQVFKVANTEDDGVARPQDPARSGSPDSLVGWDGLGREGRRFVTRGPSPEAFQASPAGVVAAPIRVYTGLDNAPDAEARAELAVAELDRTGAFDRAVLLVVTTTGSGWVNEAAVEPVELMYGGDTATVSSQYSYLPSWLSFLVDRGRAADEAQALFEAVEARLAELPADARPRLLVYGESLGSYGSETVFGSLADIRERTDGALWVGPPNSNALWRSLVERRDPGTRQVAPVYADGLVVRFADRVDDVRTPATPWEDPRVLYLQHRSDPIVWWAPGLLLQRPDWLAEPVPAGDGPVPTWYPFVTFWQVTCDLVNAKGVPDGYGHNYDTQLADAWVEVAAPAGWDDAATVALREAVAAA